MDTLTHALSGALLARALTRSAPAAATQRSRSSAPVVPATTPASSRWLGAPVPVWQAVLVGTLAAAFPDSDVVLKWVSDLAYLRGHRGVTHSVLMLPLWAALLALVASAVFRRPASFRRYAWLAAASIGIHIAGDWITQFGTMLLAPWSDARFGIGAIFIIDLVVTGIIVAGLIGCALLPRSRWPAWVALALLPAWVLIALAGKHEAIEFGRDYAQRLNLAQATVDAAPRPASPFNWTVVVFDGEHYHLAHVNTRRQEPLVVTAEANFVRRFSAPYQPLEQAQWQRLPKFGPGDQTLARTVFEHPEFEFFRWFALFPVVHQIEQAAARTCVWYRDLRFGFPGRDSVPFRYGMCRDGGGEWRLYAQDDIAGRAALR